MNQHQGLVSVLRKVCLEKRRRDLIARILMDECEGGSYWIGGSGRWEDAANWVGGHVPGADDAVVFNVPGEEIVVSGDCHCKHLTMADGKVTFDGTMVVHQNLSVRANTPSAYAVTGSLKKPNGVMVVAGSLSLGA